MALVIIISNFELVILPPKNPKTYPILKYAILQKNYSLLSEKCF